MKKNWLKWALCLVLAVGLLTCVASAAIEQADVAADTGTTITVTDGKLTVVTPGTAGTQYVLIQVKTSLEADNASALLTAAKAATTAPYELSEDTITYIDQDAAATDGKVTFSNFQPKSATTSLFVLGGDAEPKIIGAMVGNGVTVTGTVTVKGAAATDTTATVELNGETKTVALTNGVGTYSFESVPDGSYTLKVSGTAGKYVAREYAVTVAGVEVEQNAEICPKGDASNDGEVTAADFTQVVRHVKGALTLTDYKFACGDINGDGELSANDFTQVLRHVKGTRALW